ncbi:MAG: hypothetical protein ACP6IY_17985 [Promethearchaeia archaeon]
MNSKKIAVSNSGPLIHLTKVNLLDYLFLLFSTILIPESVYEEVVVRGKENNYADAFLIENKIKSGQIKIIKVNIEKNFYFSSNLHQGELEAIYLAFKSGKDLILLDDEEARIFARTLKIKVKGTLGILLDLVKSKYLQINDALKYLKELNNIMYLSSDVYNLVFEELNKISL